MAGIHGLGAKLVIASTAADTTVTELTNIGEVTMSADDIDVSSFANRVKQYVKGLIEPGEVAFEGNYQVAQGPLLFTHLTSKGTTQTQTIIVPDHFKVTFPGYLKGFSFGIPYDGKVSMNGVLKVGGTATLSTST